MSPHRIIQRRPFWALGFAVLAATALGAYSASLLAGDAREAKRDRELLCEAVNGANSSLRNLLIAARNQTPPERLTPEARRFYREQIAAVKPLDCENFDRDSLRRQQDRAARTGGDATPRAQAQQPP